MEYIIGAYRNVSPTHLFEIDLLTSPPAESFNFGLKVRSPPTLRIGVWAYTGSEDCLNVSS